MFNLTREEKQVILFLITLALIGMGVDFLKKKYSSVTNIGRFSEDIAKIDLNTADKDLLTDIPGIGEKLAQRIIEYRQKQTSFTDTAELKNIKGITNYKYEKIKDYLIVR